MNNKMRGLTVKKGIMGPVISVFVMVLVVAILAGLTFLFVASLKTNAITAAKYTGVTTVNETGGFTNVTGYGVSNRNALGFKDFSVINVINATSGALITSGNYTVNPAGIITGTGFTNWSTTWITYSYSYISDADDGAYTAINSTESAGATTISYLPLIFLAVIFGAILTLVLRIILPYVNLGQQMGGF